MSPAHAYGDHGTVIFFALHTSAHAKILDYYSIFAAHNHDVNMIRGRRLNDSRRREVKFHGGVYDAAKRVRGTRGNLQLVTSDELPGLIAVRMV